MSRVMPNMPVQNYKTYQLLRPGSTHYRPATCEEVDCEPFRQGWVTRLEKATQQEMVDLLRVTCQNTGRAFREIDEGTHLSFIFEAGQACFRAVQHKVLLEREPLYVVRRGDWRADLGSRRVHANGTDWGDDFAPHQDRIQTNLEREWY